MLKSKIKILVVLFGFIFSTFIIPFGINGQSSNPGEEGDCSMDCGDVIITCDLEDPDCYVSATGLHCGDHIYTCPG